MTMNQKPQTGKHTKAERKYELRILTKLRQETQSHDEPKPDPQNDRRNR